MKTINTANFLPDSKNRDPNRTLLEPGGHDQEAVGDFNHWTE